MPGLKKKIHVFNILNHGLLLFIAFITLYPFIYIVSVSISDPFAVLSRKVWLFPVGFETASYKYVFGANSIIRAFFNSIRYSLTGTSLALIVGCMAAYPLSEKRLKGKGIATFIIAFTMFFGAGMIPTFLVIKSLGMMNTIWAITLPGAFSAWYIILLRTSFKEIPESLKEAAFIDGANDLYILTRIVLPLSKPILVTIGLFSLVSHWNNFLGPLIYFTESDRAPLTIVLRAVLMQGQVPIAGDNLGEFYKSSIQYGAGIKTQMKMATIVIAIGPILLAYPFLQKYFVKGVMIGAIKG